MARSADGKLALVEMKAVDDTYPMLGQLTLAPPLPISDLLASATARSAPPPIRRCWRASRSRPATASPSASATFQIRSTVEAEPDKLAGGIGFGPRFLISEAGLRATGLIQPGSLVRWVYRVKLPDAANSERATDAFIADAAQRRPAGRLGDPQPLQCLAAARAQHQPIHAIPDAGRPRRAAGRRRRRRQCREEPYRPPARGDRRLQGRRRHRPRRVRHLSGAGHPAGGDRLGDRPCARRRHALRHRRPVRQAAAAAGDAGRARRRAHTVLRLWPSDRARLRLVAARPRARRAGGGAVPRHHQLANGTGRAGAISCSWASSSHCSSRS